MRGVSSHFTDGDVEVWRGGGRDLSKVPRELGTLGLGHWLCPTPVTGSTCPLCSSGSCLQGQRASLAVTQGSDGHPSPPVAGIGWVLTLPVLGAVPGTLFIQHSCPQSSHTCRVQLRRAGNRARPPPPRPGAPSRAGCGRRGRGPGNPSKGSQAPADSPRGTWLAKEQPPDSGAVVWILLGSYFWA